MRFMLKRKASQAVRISAATQQRSAVSRVSASRPVRMLERGDGFRQRDSSVGTLDVEVFDKPAIYEHDPLAGRDRFGVCGDDPARRGHLL